MKHDTYYEVSPMKYSDDKTTVTVCEPDEAQQWSVYFHANDGLAQWRADFLLECDAQIFVYAIERIK
jgi:hypothetical protein